MPIPKPTERELIAAFIKAQSHYLWTMPDAWSGADQRDALANAILEGRYAQPVKPPKQ